MSFLPKRGASTIVVVEKRVWGFPSKPKIANEYSFAVLAINSKQRKDEKKNERQKQRLFALKEQRHIVSVFKLVQDLQAPSGVKGKNQFQLLMDRLPEDHKARWFSGAALNTGDQAMASVMSTVMSRLNAFLDSEMEQVLCFDTDIDAEKFCNEKSALFIVKDDPNKNYRFATFDRRADAIRKLVKNGLKKGYLHLDGWGRDGYDREHPDVLPPCEKAGGHQSMKRLQDVCRESNILLALHDQYRDYYYDAASFDLDNAQLLVDGKHHFECTWNGGDQSILCNALAPYYIERNYDMLHALGIDPDGVYLDVFSTVDLDECDNPRHRITRKESAEHRHHCFNQLVTRGMIVSSESPVDIFVKDIVLCHHFSVVREYFSKDIGVHVPLFNLVFHDCLIVPWPTHYDEDPEIIMRFRYLLALLNGGPAYLEIDADEEQIKIIDVVSKLQEKVMYSEMVSHEFLDGGYTKQRTRFANGVTVTVDFESGKYAIES